MNKRKILAADIYFELKDIEKSMRKALIEGSLASSIYIRLNKKYWIKRNKYWDFIKRELIFPPIDFGKPDKLCPNCFSSFFWQTVNKNYVCAICYPPIINVKLQQIHPAKKKKVVHIPQNTYVDKAISGFSKEFGISFIEAKQAANHVSINELYREEDHFLVALKKEVERRIKLTWITTSKAD